MSSVSKEVWQEVHLRPETSESQSYKEYLNKNPNNLTLKQPNIMNKKEAAARNVAVKKINVPVLLDELFQD